MGLCYSSPIKLGYTIPGIRYFLWMCIDVCNIWKRERKGPPQSDPSFGEGLVLGNSDWRSKIKFYFLYISYIICTLVFKNSPSWLSIEHSMQRTSPPASDHLWNIIPTLTPDPHTPLCHTTPEYPIPPLPPGLCLSCLFLLLKTELLIFILQSPAQTSLALEIGC